MPARVDLERTGREWIGRGRNAWWGSVSWICCEIEPLDRESRKRKRALQDETIGFSVEVFINGGPDAAFPIMVRLGQLRRSSPFLVKDCVGLVMCSRP